MPRSAPMTVFLRLRPVEGKQWDFERLASIAQKAEHGYIDALYLDEPCRAAATGRPSPCAGYDSLTTTAALASRTDDVGLIATTATSSEHPFNVARFLSMLDFLSNGRAGWSVVVPESDRGLDTELPGDGEQYEHASEFVDVARAFWDAWRDDAVVRDRSAGVWARAERIRSVHHIGRHFDVRGHLPVHRSPQGHPVIVHSTASLTGAEFAARHAEVVLTDFGSLVGTKAFSDDLRERGVQLGRGPNAIRVLADLAPILAGASSATPFDAGAAADVMEQWYLAGACDGWTITPGPAPSAIDGICEQLLPELRRRNLTRTAHSGATLRDRLGLPAPAPAPAHAFECAVTS